MPGSGISLSPRLSHMDEWFVLKHVKVCLVITKHHFHHTHVCVISERQRERWRAHENLSAKGALATRAGIMSRHAQEGAR